MNRDIGLGPARRDARVERTAGRTRAINRMALVIRFTVVTLWCSLIMSPFGTIGIDRSTVRTRAALRIGRSTKPGRRSHPQIYRSTGRSKASAFVGRRVEEAVLHGVQRRSGAGRGVDLRVDALDVGASGLRCDVQGTSDLPI